MAVDVRELLDRAREARRHAYAPYSGYAVGAAVATGSGKIYTGANVENASSGLTVCAERVAILKAVTGGDRDLVAVAVVTADGATPCGACRQVLREFGAGIEIHLAGETGPARRTDLATLLPEPFTLDPS